MPNEVNAVLSLVDQRRPRLLEALWRPQIQWTLLELLRMSQLHPDPDLEIPKCS